MTSSSFELEDFCADQDLRAAVSSFLPRKAVEGEEEGPAVGTMDSMRYVCAGRWGSQA
jgi:hypothetical protein